MRRRVATWSFEPTTITIRDEWTKRSLDLIDHCASKALVRHKTDAGASGRRRSPVEFRLSTRKFMPAKLVGASQLPGIEISKSRSVQGVPISGPGGVSWGFKRHQIVQIFRFQPLSGATPHMPDRSPMSYHISAGRSKEKAKAGPIDSL